MAEDIADIAARLDRAAERIAAAIDARDARHAALRAEAQAAVQALDALIAASDAERPADG